MKYECLLWLELRRENIRAHKIILLGSSSKLASMFNGVVANDVKRKIRICLRMRNKNFFSHSPLTNFWADLFFEKNFLGRKSMKNCLQIYHDYNLFVCYESDYWLGKVGNNKLWNYLVFTFSVPCDHHHLCRVKCPQLTWNNGFINIGKHEQIKTIFPSILLWCLYLL